MDKFLILISLISGSMSLILAGPLAGIVSFAFGLFSSVFYKKGVQKFRPNGVAMIDRKREPDNLDFVWLVCSWSLIVFCFAITASSVIGGIT